MAILLALILAAAAEPLRGAHAVVTVRGAERTVVLRGRIDLLRGYRFIGRDGRQVFWLARRRDGGFEQLLRSRFRSGRPYWIDDHPPSLPLAARGFNPVGAEAFAHLALLALTEVTPGTAAVDFAGLYRRPSRYDDGRFVMPPFLREVGTLAVRWRFDAGHRVAGLAFTVPPSRHSLRRWGRSPGATVDVRLTDVDAVAAVGKPIATAIE
jgi:hypothetical protein